MKRTRLRWKLFLALLVAAAASPLVVIFWPQRAMFPDLSGPESPTPLPAAATPTPPQRYAQGNNNGIAILLQQPDSSWLGLAHGLKSIGVPFIVTRDADEALRHHVVLVYPSLTGGNTTPEKLQKLAQHARDGGTLIGFGVIGGGMPDVFGFGSSEERPLNRQVTLQNVAITAGLVDDGVAADVMLGSPAQAVPGMPGIGYLNPRNAPVALFDDGAAAITWNSFESPTGTGHAYAFGFDLGHYILRAHNGRLAGASSTYANGFQPQVDSLLRLLAGIYLQGEPDAIVLAPTPHDMPFTMLITHDVDYTRSITNIPAYVEAETAAGVPATYFIQTKYVRDYNDDAFFNPGNVSTLQVLNRAGMEIASHSVAHSRAFSAMPAGSGRERYPGYRPYVSGYDTVRSASIMGELRISRFLLDTLGDTRIQSFRPGHLSLPESLPQMLVANGFRYSSSITANQALTHLPYRLMDNRSFESEVDAWEFPVTIEDEQGNFGERFDAAVEVAERIAAYRGLVNVMIHTDALDYKLDFEQRWLDRFKGRAWFDTMAGFGAWWTARDSVNLQVDDESPASRRVHVTASGSLDGLTIEVPSQWRYQSGLEGTRQRGGRVTLGRFTDAAELVFAIDQPQDPSRRTAVSESVAPRDPSWALGP